jgi:hypothetical protein
VTIDSPAFPHSLSSNEQSMLDYFAGQALEGMMAGESEDDGVWAPPYKTLAIRCYDIAEVMLKEKQKRTLSYENH